MWKSLRPRPFVWETILFFVGLALQIGGWVSHTIAYIFFGIAFALLVYDIISQIKNKRRRQPEVAVTIQKVGLTDTLTILHRRVVELQKEKASRTKVSFIRWKKVIPTFADRMGIVKLKDWRKFERSVKSRINRAMPRKNFRRLSRLSNPKGWFIEYMKWKDEAERAALSIALQIKDELIPSGKWTIDDGIKASKWLDGYNWGVQKPRDDDPQWKGLSESISDYLRKDDVLRNLIKEHIDFSLMCNDMRLLVHYSSKFKDDVFSLMLHEALVGSLFSPEDVEIALSEILSDIDKRLEEIKNE